jgi:site-specific recombinase XerD
MRTASDEAYALDDLQELVPDWVRHLKATNHAPATVKSYLTVATEFMGYLVEAGMPTAAGSITSEHIETYLVALSERPNKRTGKPISAGHVAKHYRSLMQLFRWLDEVEGEIETTPFAKMSPPAVPEVPVPVLTEEYCRGLLATCKSNSFEDRRDGALLRLFLDSGARLGELVPLTVDDLDFDADTASVLGKGRRPRVVPFGNKTGEALRRYLRIRAKHAFAEKTTALWLGKKGHLGESGIRGIINRRATIANLPHIHPHQFRHTFAHVWLANGGQEQDLMRIAGWRSRDMVSRYGASVATERALDAHKKAGLGDRY